jgi:hypothetical protein
MHKMIERNARVVVPSDVLMREVDGEAVILHLHSESYFGLDAIGTSMWKYLTTSESVGSAELMLREEYEVSPEELAKDLDEFIERLSKLGLVHVTVG